jgi:hypothetical protein
MKRLNYYQAHKNKKPRKKKVVHRFNYFKTMLLMSTAIYASQLKIIISQPTCSPTNKQQKSLAIANHCLNFANAVSNIAKEHKRQKYLKRLNKNH